MVANKIMKIRLGFVSNSSSASFVVALNKLNEEQLKKLLDYKNVSDCYDFDNPNCKYHDYWNITVDENKGVVVGYTSMDNGYLSNYLKDCNIPEEMFVWESN